MVVTVVDISLKNAVKPVDTSVILAIGAHSIDMFSLGQVEATTGLSETEALSYNETPEDAYIFGMVNAMPGGAIFFFTNGTRLAHETKNDDLPFFEYLSHEVLHLTRIIQAQAYLGDKFLAEPWPTIGGDITEADTAELTSVIYKAILPFFAAFYESIG
jgi:hypothetical protein